MFVPVDTAIQVIVGPLIDDTDFKSLETGVAYNAAGMSVDLIKKGVNSSSKTDLTLTTASTQDWVELGNGMYSIEITAAQNDTEGTLQVVGVATGILPFASPVYTVTPTLVYNSLVAGSDNLQVDTIQVGGTTQTANDMSGDVDTVLTRLVGTIAAGTHNAQSGDAYARLGAPAGASVSADIATVDTVVDGIQTDLSNGTDGLGALATHLTDIKGGTFSGATDSLEAIRDRGDAAWTTGAGSGGLITSGTAAAIADGTITLAGSHGVTDTTVLVVLDGGTNAVGKSRIATYSGTGDVFNVDPAWNATVNGNAETTPSGTITYEIYPVPPSGSTYPLDVNVEQWNGTAVTGDGDWAADIVTAITTVDTVVDGIQTDLSNGTDGLGAIKADTAAILTDTGTTLPGVLGTPAGADMSADIAAIKAETALIVADTNELQTDDVPGLIAALNNISVADVLTTQMTESYAADGVAPTLAQALFLIQQTIGDFSISGTTLTAKQLDGTTTAATYTLDDASTPTSRTRAT